MDRIKLKILILDWVYIIIIALFLGFFISLVFFFLNKHLQHISTIAFTTISAVSISLFAFIFITISNEYILPKVKEKFWYIISFLFSFLSGFLGFLFIFYIFSTTKIPIIEIIKPYLTYISITLGFMTFLIGLILHQFISMKYRNESIKNQFLETKIKALENELNPHFLFNALNSISELIYVDQKRAEKAVLSLSSFLRNAINKESLISLSSEIEMVKTYVNIENIRFDDKIKLSTTNNLESADILVPKFSIQLLVENAIKHGFNGEVLNISIKVYNKTVSVTNDGLLPSKDLVFGTGLNNLQKRLELLCIGELFYLIEDKKVVFEIKLRE
jgi:sensor histidine kinase YesM